MDQNNNAENDVGERWRQWPEDLREIAEILDSLERVGALPVDNWLAEDDVDLLNLELGAPQGLENVQDMAAALLEHAIGPDDDEIRHSPPGIGPEPPRQLQRGPRRPYNITAQLRQTNWFERSLEWENKWFRRAYRMSKTTFHAIIDRISADAVFQTKGTRPQRPVIYQLGVFLLRYGLRGSPALEPAMKVGIGEGTVFLYCERVIRAIRMLGLDVVGWPNEERKAEIKLAFERRLGLDGIIGVVDGSLIEIARDPTFGAKAFYCRKGFPAIHVQAVTDHQCCFTAFETGWPGSRNDKFVWQLSYPWTHRDQLFGEGEFLLGDAGYPLTPYVLIPYMRDEMGEEGARKRRFNQRLSSSRVLVECAFGRLKARFPALTLMGAVGKIDNLYRSVEALMILHNVCYGYHDTVTGLPDAFTQDALDRIERRMRGGAPINEDDELYDMAGHIAPGELEENVPNDVHLLAEGREFREHCMDIVVPRG